VDADVAELPNPRSRDAIERVAVDGLNSFETLTESPDAEERGQIAA
jgi:hypothetical protein